MDRWTGRYSSLLGLRPVWVNVMTVVADKTGRLGPMYSWNTGSRRTMKIDLNHRKTKFPTILIKSEIRNIFFHHIIKHFDHFWSFLNIFDRFWPFLIDFDWFWLILIDFWSISIDFDWFWSILIVLCTLKINKTCFGQISGRPKTLNNKWRTN